MRLSSLVPLCVIRVFAVAATVGACVLSQPAGALIVQPTGSLPSGLPTDAVGTWGGNAGAVAIGESWVLTTRHQDAGTPLRTVTIAGETYNALSENQIIIDAGTDLRLVKLTDQSTGEDAVLTTYVDLYSGAITNPVAIAGFGPTIGAFNVDGYDWSGSLNNSNGLTFGQNTVDGTAVLGSGTYSGMTVLVADFDQAPGAGSVAYEATGSFGDSGGGWFVQDGGNFLLVGLTHGVEIDGDDDFDGSTTNNDPVSQAFFGQQFIAVDLRPFVDEINALMIPEPTAALALVLPCILSMVRSRRRA